MTAMQGNHKTAGEALTSQNSIWIGPLKEAKPPFKQILEGLMTSLAGFIRSNTLLVSAIAIEAAYFLSSIIGGNTFVRVIITFPAAYILPGLTLRLLISKSNLEDAPNLLVESFVISTIVNVVAVSMLILLDLERYNLLLPIFHVILVVFLILLMKFRNDLPELSANRVDKLIILTCLVVYLVTVALYSFTPRLLTPDETDYIDSARHALLTGKVYDVNAGSSTSAFTYLINGRFFWNLLTASFLASTGSQPHLAHLLSPMFLFMIALASFPLLPETLRKRGLPRFSVALVLLTNPLLFYFSRFILNDLAVAFYITFAVALFVNSFKHDSFGKSIDFSRLILCLSIFLLAMVFIKANMTVFFPMYFILLFFALRSKTRVMYRRFGYILVVLPILYELLIDIPYNLFNWFLENEFLAQLFYRFLWISPLEFFLGLFSVRSWKSSTIFFHDTPQYLQLGYTMISPEVLGLILASITLAAPFALTLKWVRRDQKMVILSFLLAVSLLIEYFVIISNYSFRDAPRFGLFLIPMIVVFSLSILLREIHEHNVSVLLMFWIPAVLFLWVLSFLSVQMGGIYFYYSYGTPLLNWTITIVMPQLIVYSLVLSLMSAKRTNILGSVPFARIKQMGKHFSLSKILYSTLIIAIIVQNVYVSAYCIGNSSFFGHGHGLSDTQRLLANENENPMIFLNSYMYVRNYVSDNVLAEGRLFPLPSSESEFLQLLDFAPNGSLIMINTDYEIAWLESANNYVRKYVDLDSITSNISNAHAIKIKNEYVSTGQIGIFRIVNSLSLNRGTNQVTIKDSRLALLSGQERVLRLNIFSDGSSYIKTMIGTNQFIEFFNTSLSSGENVVELGGDDYWQYLARVRVVIRDPNGEIVFDGEVEMFNLEDIQLSFTFLLTSILLVVLFLTKRSNLSSASEV